MKLVIGLVAVLMHLVSAAPINLAFSGALTNVAGTGLSVSVASGSSCSVEYQVLDEMGVNCTVLVNFASANNKFDYTATLSGGVNLIPVNNMLDASVNYKVAFPDVINPKNVYQFPSAASGKEIIALPFPATAFNVSAPLSICLTDIAGLLSSAGLAIEGTVAKEILALTGSNACVKINFVHLNSKGAALSLNLNVDLFDLSTITNTVDKDALALALNVLQVSKDLPIKYNLNLGAAIQNFAVSGSVSGGAGRMRALAASGPAYIDQNGNFLLGQQTAQQQPGQQAGQLSEQEAATLSPGAIAGIGVGAGAMVLGAIAAGVVVYRRRVMMPVRV